VTRFSQGHCYVAGRDLDAYRNGQFVLLIKLLLVNNTLSFFSIGESVTPFQTILYEFLLTDTGTVYLLGKARRIVVFGQGIQKIIEKEGAIIKLFSIQMIGALIFPESISSYSHAGPAIPGVSAGPHSTPSGVSTCTST
jgi:hypothetical protein